MCITIKKSISDYKTTEWILRIAVAGEFIGHGIFALQVKEGWVPFFEWFGISAETATILLPIIGILDLILAVIILVRPIKVIVLWMAFWGLWTALLRPLTGGEFLDFIERWANWGAPLALIFILGWPKKTKDWWK